MSPSMLEIRARIEDIYRSGKVRGEDGVEYPIENTSVTPERGHFLADLCRSERAIATLEIPGATRKKSGHPASWAASDDTPRASPDV